MRALSILVTIIGVSTLSTAANAAPFTPGNIVVSRVGTGSGTLSGAAAAVFLDEYTPAGALVQSITLPATAVGSNARFALSGSATSEGALLRSPSGEFLTLAGYDAAPGTASLAGTTSAATNRIVALVEADGNVDTTTRIGDGYSGSNIRSALTVDGEAFWTSGNGNSGTGGIRYVLAGNAAANASVVVGAAPNNARFLGSFGNELFISSGSAPYVGVSKVGAGMPTGTGNATSLVFASNTGSTNPYGFVLLDRDASVPGLDTAYVGDSGSGLQKYSFDGSVWTFRGSVAQNGLSGLTAEVDGGTVTIYGVAPGALVKFQDGGNSTASLSGSFTTIATAGTNKAFRGVAFAPESGGGSTMLTGTGVATPNTIEIGQQTLLTVAVTPGTNPASTGISVTANLSSIGGALNQALVDDGTQGDAVAGDLVFSYLASPTTGSGSISLPVAMSDAQSRSSSASIALTLTGVGGITRIHAIQGVTDTSATGALKIEGIVTAVYPDLGGFYVEEEEGDRDANPLTSEGIFVQSNASVSPGQKVSVSGTVSNEFGLTQFSAGAAVTVTDSGTSSLPSPAIVELPVPSPENGTAYLERYEGMRVQFPGALYVADNYNLGRFGEVALSQAKHLFIPTNSIDPNDAPSAGVNSSGTSNVSAVLARMDLNARSRIILDDARDREHPAPIPYLYTTPTGRTLRLGDSVTNLQGILSYGFSAYRLRPIGDVSFTATNARTAAPPALLGNVRVASFNVLNYFVTFGGSDDRGADGAAELVRQRAKIVAALKALNADVVGLIEIQNNGTGANSAVHDLLNHPNGLNAAMITAGEQPYSVVVPPANPLGTDVITCALIYKPSKVTPVGASITDTANLSVYNRPPLTQLFSVNANGGSFYVCVNHFKSKGASDATGADRDQGDGQSAYNQRRKNQATALISFLNGLKVNDPDILVTGDLNAYGEEDPMDLFRAAGYIDAVSTRSGGAEAYTYLFSAEVGRLDHALATPSLNQQITGAAAWHINADEPRIIDYNLDTNDQQNPPPKTDDAYTTAPHRSSDHDPVLVGLQINGATLSLSPDYGRAGSTVVITGPNLGSASSVRFAGNIAAQFTINSNSQITATVPSGALSGAIQVSTGASTLVSVPFKLLPKINSFQPASGAVGAEVLLTGSGFSGASAVKFADGLSASFVVVSDTQIRATVPAGAIRGTIRVESPGGSATSLNRFTVLP